MEEPRALKNSELVDPRDDLDELGKAILRIELMNPGITIAQIIRLLNRDTLDWRTVKARRNMAIYQRTLKQAHKSALELAAEAETDAIRELVRLLKTSKSEKIRLSAARALVGGTLEYRKMSLAKELARQQADNAPIKKVVEVVFRDVGSTWSAQGPQALPPPQSSPQDSVTIQPPQPQQPETAVNAPGSTTAAPASESPTATVIEAQPPSPAAQAPSWADVIGSNPGEGSEADK